MPLSLDNGSSFRITGSSVRSDCSSIISIGSLTRSDDSSIVNKASSIRSESSSARSQASSIRSQSSSAKSLTSSKRNYTSSNSSECFIDVESISPKIKIWNSFTDYCIAPSPPSSPIDQTLELYLKDYRMENIENENFDAKTHDYANDKDFQNHLAIFALKCERRIVNLTHEGEWINNLW